MEKEGMGVFRWEKVYEKSRIVYMSVCVCVCVYV